MPAVAFKTGKLFVPRDRKGIAFYLGKAWEQSSIYQPEDDNYQVASIDQGIYVWPLFFQKIIFYCAI